MRSIAFVILKYPSEGDPTALIKTLAGGAKISVILLEDGVYWAVMSDKQERLQECKAEIFAASDDLIARGFDEPVSGVKVVDYEKIVEIIMEEYDRVITL
ncbi:MAG: sulfurtransferase complex subunit TusB [Halobacteriota archaeon]|nr:sulfurtransferase complex subunit TusB [Halobacteriota archaeon]